MAIFKEGEDHPEATQKLLTLLVLWTKIAAQSVLIH